MVKKSDCQCRRCGFNPWVRRIPWRRKRQPTPVFLPGKSHGQRSLAGYREGHKEWDTTERLSDFTFTSSQNRGDQRHLQRIWARKSQQGLEARVYSVSHSFWTVQQTLIYQTFAFLSPCELPSSQVPKHCPPATYFVFS